MMLSTSWDEWVVSIAMGVAAFLNAAILFDRQIVESHLMMAGRRLIIATQIWIAIRFGYIAIFIGDSALTWYGLVGFTMWGLGSSMCSLDHIGQRWGHDLDSLIDPSPLKRHEE